MPGFLLKAAFWHVRPNIVGSAHSILTCELLLFRDQVDNQCHCYLYLAVSNKAFLLPFPIPSKVVVNFFGSGITLKIC